MCFVYIALPIPLNNSIYRYFYHPHFTGDETETPRSPVIFSVTKSGLIVCVRPRSVLPPGGHHEAQQWQVSRMKPGV
jgi:hypothetical protein